MYYDHLRLTGKRVVDFQLVLIELFSLGIMAEVLRVSIGSKSAILLQWGSVDPKFQLEGVAPSTILLLRKLGYMISCMVQKIWTTLSSVLSQSTRLTDRQLFVARLHCMQCMQHGKNEFLY